jgi:phytoene dehydrogenase-like protein
MVIDAIVIGAGPNGLTAAAALAKRGKRVVVLESADAIGGHTRAIEFAPGFRSPLNEDCGWVPENVARGLGLGSPALPTVTRNVSTSIAVDGALFTLPSSPSKAAELIGKHSAKDAARWPAFVERLAKFADVLGRIYQLPPVDIETTSMGELLPLAGLALHVRRLGRADMTEFMRVMPMSVQDLVDDEFETEWLKTAIASAAIRDLRQGPRSGGTTFNLLHYMVGAAHGSFRARHWFEAGPDAFAVAAADAARKLGAEVRTGARVERIVVRNGAVAGVALKGGEEIAAPIVISTADPKRTLLDLIEPQWLDPEVGLAVSNVKLRGCTAFVLFATDLALGESDKHLIATVGLTSSTVSLEKAADAAKYGEISAELHIEFFAPTLRWPSLAPAGKHVISARVQYAPYALKEGAWTKAHAEAVGKKVAAAIARVIPKFAESVKHSLVLTPKDIEERFGVTEGALTHGEMTLDQIMFMRPVPGWGRYAMPVHGLFLGGAGAHPGPGILGGAGFLAARSALHR